MKKMEIFGVKLKTLDYILIALGLTLIVGLVISALIPSPSYQRVIQPTSIPTPSSFSTLDTNTTSSDIIVIIANIISDTGWWIWILTIGVSFGVFWVMGKLVKVRRY